MVQRFLEQVITEKEPIREIRIRIGKPVFVLDSEGEKILNFDEKRGNPELLRIEDEKENSGIENGSMADSELIRALMEIFARHSLYAYEREISQGFLTIRGGHRIGITGKAVVESGHVNSPGYLILKHPHRPRDKRMREIRAAASSVRGRVS